MRKHTIPTHRVVTFLGRGELEFLDKLEKDAMFSTGKSLSRSQIIQDMAELLARTSMNAVGIRTDEQLQERILDAMTKLKTSSPDSTVSGSRA
jgi:hypothetical protein